MGDVGDRRRVLATDLRTDRRWGSIENTATARHKFRVTRARDSEVGPQYRKAGVNWAESGEQECTWLETIETS